MSSINEAVPCRIFEFDGGTLILKKSDFPSDTDEDIIEVFGCGKGRLLKTHEENVSLAELESLEDFRDM